MFRGSPREEEGGRGRLSEHMRGDYDPALRICFSLLVVSRCPVIRMLPSDLNIGLNTLNGHSSRVMIRRSHPLIRINEPITSRVAVNVNTIRFIFLIDRFI